MTPRPPRPAAGGHHRPGREGARRQRRRLVLGEHAGRDGRPRPRSSGSTRPTCRSGSRARSATSIRSPTSDRRKRAGTTASPSSASRPRPTRSSDAGELGADPSRCAVVAGTGVGGLETPREPDADLLREGRRPRQPVHGSADDGERHRRRRRHAARLDRPEPVHRHRVRRRRPRHRRGCPPRPRRHRRRRAGRRHRGVPDRA